MGKEKGRSRGPLNGLLLRRLRRRRVRSLVHAWRRRRRVFTLPLMHDGGGRRRGDYAWLRPVDWKRSDRRGVRARGGALHRHSRSLLRWRVRWHRAVRFHRLTRLGASALRRGHRDVMHFRFGTATVGRRHGDVTHQRFGVARQRENSFRYRPRRDVTVDRMTRYSMRGARLGKYGGVSSASPRREGEPTVARVRLNSVNGDSARVITNDHGP